MRIRFCLLYCLLGPLFGTSLEAADTDGIQFYESKIRPLLLEHCASCHGPDEQESDLRVDSPGHLLLGGKSGPIVLPGKPDQSLLLSAVRYKDEALQMPPDEKLPAAAIADLVKWVEMGAPTPDAEVVASKQRIPFDLETARQHWSFKPLTRPALPASTGTWVSTANSVIQESASENLHPIDRFILQKLNEKGLSPAPPAEKRTLIRRASIDLIGLPPTPEQIQRFLEDESPDAFSKVVDELLDSPQYGERWGRHWLDVARYADSNGLDENVAHGNAWRYRDYVVAAFNSDKPFNQFVREQIAGDLISDDPATLHERLIATGFLSIGPKVLAESDKTKMLMDIIDEQIDTTGRVFLGLTLGCARCHDHKFDPIRADDYYALAGILKSTSTMESLTTIAKWNEHIIASPEQLEEKQLHDQKVAVVQEAIDALKKRQMEEREGKTAEKTVSVDAVGEVNTTAETKVVEVKDETTAESSVVPIAEQLKLLDQQLKDLKAKAPLLPTAMGVKEATPMDVPIHVRGSHLSLGREVARGMPLVLSTGEPTLKHPQQSGRRELADWLSSPENPLTVRVWVNRVWRWHFGEGLVPTVDNFGLLGELPSHPELLDWLAVEFMEQGWSTKSLHRQMLLSKTYQMSSSYHAENAAIDPENRFYWRAHKQRMEAEVFRDALLAVSGQLDTTMGGSLLHVGNREFIFNHTSKDETNYNSVRRSIYLPVIRNNLFDGFSLFDYTDASVPNGDRESSTVAPQALYALNSELVLTAAETLAEQLLKHHPDNLPARLEMMFECTFGRLPLESEGVAIQDFLQTSQTIHNQNERQAWTSLCQIFLISNEFIYVE